MLLPFLTLNFLQRSLRFTENWQEGTEISHVRLPPPMHSLPHHQRPHQSGTFVTIGEATLPHHNLSESIVYIRAHSWCRRFCGFGQMRNDMHSSFQYHTECFHRPKSPLCSACCSSLPHLWQPLIRLLSRQFCLFQKFIEL